MATPDFVSIHAPVKGATTADIKENDKVLVSIHAPVKGATIEIQDQFV